MAENKEYLVGDFMKRKVVAVAPSATIRECARIMAGKDVSSAVVKDKEAVAGIVTEKDVTRRAVAAGLDLALSVEKIMTSPVVTIPPETLLYDAMLLFGQKKIKHLPVVRKGKLIGIITAMDILRIQPAYIDILRYPEL